MEASQVATSNSPIFDELERSSGELNQSLLVYVERNVLEARIGELSASEIVKISQTVVPICCISQAFAKETRIDWTTVSSSRSIRLNISKWRTQ